MDEAHHLGVTGRSALTADDVSRRSADAAEPTPFFLVGSPRSGTTLLRLILTGHSRLEIPPETWFIMPLVAQFPMDRNLTPEEVAKAVTIMTEHYRWPDMVMTAETLRDKAAALTEPRLVDIVNLVYGFHLASAGKSRFGDKTPPYIEIVREISVLYPGAKFIHLVRDGRDVAVSFFDLQWGEKGTRCYEHRFDWTRALWLRRAYRQAGLEGQFLDVMYEDLMTEPEATLRRICAFLNEEFEPGLLKFAQRTDRVPARERSIHPKLSEPLSEEAIGRWRTKLSALECFIMEACLQRDLRRWGYELRFKSLAWRPALVLSGWLLYGIGPLLAKGIPYLRRRNYWPKNVYI